MQIIPYAAFPAAMMHADFFSQEAFMSIISISVDAAIVIALLIGLIVGAKRGFIKTVAKPVKILAALACAVFLCSWFGTQFIQPNIDQPIRSHLTEYLNEKCPELSEENAVDNLPTVLKIAAEIGKVDLNALAEEADGDLCAAVVDRLTEPVAHIIATVLSFIILYIGARLILWLLVMLLNALFNTAVLRWLNQGLGLIFGGITALIGMWGLVILAELVFGFAFSNAAWVADVRSGWVYSFFLRFSPLDLIFGF